jgi:transposase
MTLDKTEIGEVPEGTRRVAQAAFPKGTLYMRMRDELGVLWEEADFQVLYGRVGQTGYAAWRLVLVTLMQYNEGLSDRAAADAVRGRIDWKYALGMELEDAGFDYSILSEFRGRLIEGEAGYYLLEMMLRRCQALQLVKSRGRQRTDATHILAAVRALNREELVGESLRAALNELATIAPEWVKSVVPAAWYERYGRRIERSRLPKQAEERLAWVEQTGRDGQQLLTWLKDSPFQAAPWARPMLVRLGTVWQQQFHLEDGLARWRTADELPPAAQQLESPYDEQARYGAKRDLHWLGYKVHVTETCDAELPHLITHVLTVPAGEADSHALPIIHERLNRCDLLPQQHLVDSAYVSAALVHESRQVYGLDLLGPLPADTSWQTTTPLALSNTDFLIDWAARQVTCPSGALSSKWVESHNQAGQPSIQVAFDKQTCLPCPLHARCTHAPARTLKLHPQPLHEVLQTARLRQLTPDFKQAYNQRAGIEGTLSQAVRALDLRHSRYRGLPKTALQQSFTAMALNLRRLGDWWDDLLPAHTRSSAFAKLAA